MPNNKNMAIPSLVLGNLPNKLRQFLLNLSLFCLSACRYTFTRTNELKDSAQFPPHRAGLAHAFGPSLNPNDASPSLHSLEKEPFYERSFVEREL
jgi:hypothetical protein